MKTKTMRTQKIIENKIKRLEDNIDKINKQPLYIHSLQYRLYLRIELNALNWVLKQ